MSDAPQLPVGQTWLLAAGQDGHGSLWALAPPGGNIRSVAFQYLARDAAWDAQQLARWYAAAGASASEQEIAHGAVFVWWTGPRAGPGQTRTLDGPSFGLPLALAAVSARLGLQMPANLASTGALGRIGDLRKVDGLEQKVGVLGSFAREPQPFPGRDTRAVAISRLLVPRGNDADAREVANRLGFRDLEIVPVSTVAEALVATFGEETLRAAEERVCEGRAEETARRLFELTLAGSFNFLPWEAVDKLARTTARLLPEDSHSRREAEVAAAIAARHAMEPQDLPAETLGRLADFPRPVALRLAAHVVQGCADSADDRWTEVVRRVEGLLGDDGPCEGSARVLGALGRLYAAWLRYDEALEHLARAAETWRRLYQLNEASYALCEWLRVASLHQPGDLQRVVAEAQECLVHPAQTPQSAEYLLLALLRAAAATGDLGAARARFEALPGDSSLRFAAQRHLAIAGDVPAFDVLEKHGHAPDLQLAMLGLGRGSPASLLAELEAMPRHARDLRRLRDRLGHDGVQVARHWRY